MPTPSIWRWLCGSVPTSARSRGATRTAGRGTAEYAGARHFIFWREQEWREVLAAAGWSVERLDLRPGSKLGENWVHVVAVRPD